MLEPRLEQSVPGPLVAVMLQQNANMLLGFATGILGNCIIQFRDEDVVTKSFVGGDSLKEIS